MTAHGPKPAPFEQSEHQAAELAVLRRVLAASQGEFSLSVATCNSPALRDYLIDKLRRDTPGIEIVRLAPDSADVLDAVRTAAGSKEHAALFIVGLEELLKSSGAMGVDNPSPRALEVLRALNTSREMWPQHFALPVVFWLPEYASGYLPLHARDFWSCVSHRLEFVSEAGTVTAGVRESFAGDLTLAGDLTEEQKRFRIAELESRLVDAGESPPADLAVHVSIWLTELGFLYARLGELDQAEEMFRRGLAINEKCSRLEGIASCYGNLGMVYFARSDLGGAEEMYRKALEINERLGRLDGVADQRGNLGTIYGARGNLDRAEEMHRKALEINVGLGRLGSTVYQYKNLGVIYLERGDLDRAEEMHRKAREIDEKLGWLEGMAGDYGDLGAVYQTRGDLDRAEEMHRKALEIDEKLGALPSVAGTYGSLGSIYQTRGDLDRAEEMHRKALEIDEKLGRLEGIANRCSNLGLIAELRGRQYEARALWTRARKLFEQIGMPHMVEKVQGWLDALGDGGEDASQGG